MDLSVHGLAVLACAQLDRSIVTVCSLAGPLSSIGLRCCSPSPVASLLDGFLCISREITCQMTPLVVMPRTVCSAHIQYNLWLLRLGSTIILVWILGNISCDGQ